MQKDRRAQVLTVVFLLVGLGVVLGRKTGWRFPDFRPSSIAEATASQNPQDAIYAMLSAARAGDVRAYLAGYTGQMETALLEALAETTEPTFAKYLKDSNAAVKGVAVS